MSHFNFNMFKGDTQCANKKRKPEYMRHRRLNGLIILVIGGECVNDKNMFLYDIFIFRTKFISW